VEKIDAELIFKVAAEGDAMCNRLIEEVCSCSRNHQEVSHKFSLVIQAAEYLGFACVNFSRSLDPQVRVGGEGP
jgi:hypothetical protein